MRSDMGKVITERPRTAGCGLSQPKGYKKRLQRTPLDELPSRESMNRWDKEFTDVIGPLEGFLKKNCGRPWNKIMSEVNKVLPATGGVSYSHARDHLFQMVELHTQKIDGKICDSKGVILGTGYRWNEFYVDPHGILRKLKRHPWRRQWKKKVIPKTEDGRLLLQDTKGIWFAVTVAPYESDGSKIVTTVGTYYQFKRTVYTYPIVFDVFQRSQITSPRGQIDLVKIYGAEVYAVSKKQLNSKEIKHYKLR